MNPTLTLASVAELVGGELRGDPDIQIQGVGTVAAARPGDLTWVTSAKYAQQLHNCRASAVLVARGVDPGPLPAVFCERPDAAIVLALGRLQKPLPHPTPGIDPTAVIGQRVDLQAGVAIGPRVIVQDEARIGRGSILHAGVFIGQGTVLGSDCVLWPNAVVRERCTIGDRVVIHPNAVIGADGFGLFMKDGVYHRIPHIGGVRIENDVEIGAGSCVDRAKCGDTVIGRGTKIDNLVQVGHNVQVGEHCCIVAQAGIGGSAALGHHVVLAGKVGIKDHVHIGNGAQIAACSCVASNVPDGAELLGVPAISKAQFIKERSAARRLPAAIRQLRELVERVKQLEAAHNQKTS